MVGGGDNLLHLSQHKVSVDLLVCCSLYHIDSCFPNTSIQGIYFSDAHAYRGSSHWSRTLDTGLPLKDLLPLQCSSASLSFTICILCVWTVFTSCLVCLWSL